MKNCDLSTYTSPVNEKFAIIGCGIIGLSLGIELKKSNPNCAVTIFEKEVTVGQHASGRNSGVLHAGFYYSPDSLKAKFCKDGNQELKLLHKRHGLQLKNCGKVVVATNLEDSEDLAILFNNGLENGVDVELLDESKLSGFEPMAKTFGTFLWSPTTSVGQPKEVLVALLSDFLEIGGKVEFNSEIELEIKGEEVLLRTIKGSRNFDHIYNAAGTYADKLARDVGVGERFACLPFRGNYWVSTSNPASWPSRLIYPVPHRINPFLGVHLTLTNLGQLKIGPTALPILGREQYDFADLLSMKRIEFPFKAYLALFQSDEVEFMKVLKSEMPKQFLANILNLASKLTVTNLKEMRWKPSRPGIRAQLVDLENGSLVKDYLVLRGRNVTHILNAVSPGWTSAMPFARWIVNQQ
jgi:L-2-hydroxyglutarate oxidase LhgO